MSQSANVKSVAAIQDFKVAMANFADDARNALNGVESDLRKTRNWLQRDQLSYWQAQVKRRNEDVSTARTELHRRKLSQQGSEAVSDTEQKEALRLAQRRLEEAERKFALVKKWGPILEHAIAEYHSAAQPLGDRLTGAFVNSLNLLDRMVASIDAYLAVTAPSIADIPGASAATAGPAGGASTSAAPTARATGESAPKDEAAPAEEAPSETPETAEHPHAKAGDPRP
jgi:hypothetical protein